MKKILIIIFSFVFLSSNVFANDKYLNEFNKWLIQNNHTQYFEINKQYEECRNCNWDPLPRCFDENNKPKKQCVLDGDQSYYDTGEYKWIQHEKYKSKLKIKFFKKKDGKII